MPEDTNDMQFDDIIRNASDQYDPVESPGDWSQMQKILDREMPEDKRSRRRFFWWIFPAGALLCVSYLIFFQQKNNMNIDPSRTGRIEKTVLRNKPVMVNEHPILNKGTKEPIGIFQEPADSNLKSKISHTENIEIASVKRKSVYNSNNYPDLFLKNAAVDETIPIPNNNDSEINTVEKKVPFATIPEKDFITPLSLPISTLLDKDSVLAIIKPARTYYVDQEEGDSQINDIAERSKAKSIQQNKWIMSIQTGIDFSSVGFNQLTRPGMIGGLNIGRYINSKWSFHTGIYYTKKYYSAEESQIKLPPNYFPPNVKLDFVEGSCNMWEIPINFRYHLNPNNMNRIWLSGGLSSYFMNKQHYEYYYVSNGYPYSREKTYEQNSSYWWGIINLSVAYERSLNKKWSVSIEPYFKIPLQGMGYWDLKMSSTGLLLSLQFSPSKKP